MLDHLQEIAGILAGFGIQERIYLDFSLANSMDYYNGLIFQGALSGIPFTVLSGGRYDRLPEKMGKPFGAIGFAVYMDIVENRRHSRKNFDGDILILYRSSDRPSSVSKAAEALRRQGKTVSAVSEANAADPNRWRCVMTLKEAKEEAGL